MRPLSDLQAVLYVLVYLASGSLPWMAAARRGDKESSLASMWTGLMALRFFPTCQTGVPLVNTSHTFLSISQINLLLTAAGRKDIIRMGSAWSGLSCLPTPVATFGAWVLMNAPRDHLPSQELEAQVAILRDAIIKTLPSNP